MSKSLTPAPADLIPLTMQAQQVLEFLQSGYRIPEIARKLDISRREVRGAMLMIHRRDFEQGLLKRDHLKAEAVVDYDYIAHELTEAWEESKPGPLPEGATIEQRIEWAKAFGKRNYTNGDARYLQLALVALQAKHKLLGLAGNQPGAGGPKMPELPAGGSATVQLYEKLVTVQINSMASAGTVGGVGRPPEAGAFRAVEPAPEPEAGKPQETTDGQPRESGASGVPATVVDLGAGGSGGLGPGVADDLPQPEPDAGSTSGEPVQARDVGGPDKTDAGANHAGGAGGQEAPVLPTPGKE